MKLDLINEAKPFQVQDLLKSLHNQNRLKQDIEMLMKKLLDCKDKKPLQDLLKSLHNQDQSKKDMKRLLGL